MMIHTFAEVLFPERTHGGIVLMQSSIAGSYVVREETAGSAVMFKCTICGRAMAQRHNAMNHVANIHWTKIKIRRH